MKTTSIVGAGIIGLACAVELQRRGQKVTLIDQQEPGRGCSFGNAGIIAASDVLPLITPGRIAALPRMLLDAEGPARIRVEALPTLLPWLWRAAATLTARRQAEITGALAALNGAALQSWRTLLAYCGAGPLLVERGMIELLSERMTKASLQRHVVHLRDMGQALSIITPRQIGELEPGLRNRNAVGILHEGNAHVRDPYLVAQALLETFRGKGGLFLQEEVHAILPSEGIMRLQTSAGTREFASIVIAAGSRSPQLLKPLGIRTPIQIERGYHLHLTRAEGLITRPIAFQEESFVATPMAGGFRLAGTVEFALSHSKADWRRADLLRKHAQPYFKTPLEPSEDSRWVGDRPSLPDSLPAIGAVRNFSGLYYAFGHQHLGLTQAAITARLVAALVGRTETVLNVHPFDAARFDGAVHKRSAIARGSPQA